MDGYWKVAPAWAGKDPRAETRGDGPHALDDVSPIGQHHGAEESLTAAIGRVVSEQFAGAPPEAAETKTALSYIVHYGYGSLQGGIYGVATGADGFAQDVATGPGFGTALWLFGDELGVSLLGLADGPGKYPLSQHLYWWGAHLPYGLATALTTAPLRRLV